MAFNCKPSPPFIFSPRQQVLFRLLLLYYLAFMLPSITSAITSTSTGNTTRGCIKAERDALLAFKSQITYHKSHPISAWGDQNDDCCHWAGVHCDSTSGHVIRLTLQSSELAPYYDYSYFCHASCYEWGLSGNISESLISLQHLRYLDLSSNCFLNISIPKLLGSLENLVHLDLSYSCFTGFVPHELGNLTRLRYLNLATYEEVRYKVDDAEWLSGLFPLRYLSMDGADFSGVNNVMQSLNKLHHLKEVSLFDCIMNSIPESLPYLNFPSLAIMDISSTILDNTSIPEWLFRIPNLRELHMDSTSLTGTIPSSVGNATSLQYLDLSFNSKISGDMPKGLSNLCNLQSLRLDITFVGKSLEDFRDAFSRCISQNLNELSFAGSSLQGPLPDWLGEFKNLTFLDLSDNSFHSSIPASIGRLSQLQELDLSGNALNDPLPESLFHLSNLSSLDITNNNFNYTSVITEAHLANLTSLEYLSLNKLVLNIGNDWIPGFQARQIDISYCQVGPKFPLWLANQVNLYFLHISHAGIRDSIPGWFWNISYSITSLDLSNNEINGWLPQRLKFQEGELSVEIFLSSNRLEGPIPYFSPSVGVLDLSNNLFSGSIPSGLGNFGGIRPRLTFLSLSSNNFNGSIPNSLCNLVDLVLLDFSNNHLEGLIPNCWNNLTGLEYLIWANNSLVGEVPNSLVSSWQFLQVLHLSNNQLHGEFPSFLKKCNAITTLALDHNNLSGVIPSWVGETMTSLMILILKKNNFSGNLPLLSNLTSLHFLDLSHNLFVGSIPQSFGSLTAMINTSMEGGAWFSANLSEAYVIAVTISIKGTELQYGVTLSSLRFIDLSANNLSGQNPKGNN